MPTSTLPSKKVSVVDVPEPTTFRGLFRYNFFTPDEKKNGLGSAPKSYLSAAGKSFTPDLVGSLDFNSVVPRYVELFWQPCLVGNRPDIVSGVSIKDNLDKLQYEDSFTYDDFGYLKLQDTGVDGKLEFYVKRAYDILVGDRLTTTTPQEKAVLLNAKTSKGVKPTTLGFALNNQLKTAGTSFYDRREGNQQPTANSTLEELKKVKIESQVNNKLINDVLAAAAYEDSLSPFADEVKQQMDEALTKQRAAASIRDSSIFDADEYDVEIKNNIKEYNILNIESYDSVLQTIGYVIFREEVKKDGSITVLDPIIVESPSVASTVDVRVKYDAVYRYRIHTVAYVELPCYDLERENVAAVGFLLASRPVEEEVTCVETVPPPTVADFNVHYDYDQRSAILTWSFPVNPQRDIKKFQVFRRRSINEPFQLLKMYDFDDSELLSPFNEYPDPELVEVGAKTFYVDREFTKTSNFIYAVTTVDAHGYTSGYSMQFLVGFDAAKNKMTKTLISVANAPKAYPNMFLNRDTFVDTIKDEGHGSLKVYFNPEYLKVFQTAATGTSEADLKLLATKETDTYVLQLINIDLQSQQKIEIKLEDRLTDPTVFRV